MRCFDSLVIMTGNNGKLNEIKQMLAAESLSVRSYKEFFPDINWVETGSTFRENATIKLESFPSHPGVVVLADDSGLEVDALKGAPGVYSARYAGEGASDTDNCLKILDALKNELDRKARFKCVLAYCFFGEDVSFVEGTVEGEISTEMRGSHGFGYDPIFVPNGYVETFAELGSDVKNKLSHRSKALEAFKKIL